jgi:putative ABC transport system permease protein
MFWLRQTLAVMALNIRTIPSRLSSSAVAIVGIAGVVVVFVSVLSIAAGFSAAMNGSGSRGRALVMRSGADSEMTSGVSGAEADIIKQAPGIARDGRNAVASAELYVIVDLPKKSTPGSSANVPMRGIEPEGMALRPEVSIIEGRMFRFGTNEVIAGRGANGQFVSLNVGDTIVSGQNRWQVVGRVAADGGGRGAALCAAHGAVAETEIWCDGRTLQGAYRRGNTYQSVLAGLETQDSFDTFRDWLTSNPQLNVSIRRENEYYAGQSQTMTRLIQTIGVAIATLMGIGAVFGAILTMYTAVATRAREIATLRALGFETSSVLVSVLTESMVLGAVGGVIGAAAAYAGFNGYQTSTMNFQTFSQVAFAFRVTPQLLGIGLSYALAMGFVGGLLPAFRAARLPIPQALREL